jgi:alpha-tubulin suppressor-like RCC1 family protein
MRARDGGPGELSRVERRGRRALVPVLVLTLATLLSGVLPVAAASPTTSITPSLQTSEATVDSPKAGATTASTRVGGWDFIGGEPLAAAPLEATCGGDGQEPCPASELLSGGGGGYIPVAAERVLDTTAGGGAPLGRGETRTIQVGGAGSVPLDGVQAVALSITATDATAWTEITAWTAGMLQPPEVTLDAQPGSAHRVLALVPPSTDGRISVANAQGRVDLQIDVIGWFSTSDEFMAVTRARLFDTNPGKGRRPSPLGPDQAVTVQVADRAGVPATGVRAVVLAVASRTASVTSTVRLWATGADRPAGGSLVGLRADRRSNLVIVAPGADGTVSVHNAVGWTHLTIDVVGWLPEAGTYRTVAPAPVYATPADGSIAMGETVEITVAGQGGVPAVDDDTAREKAHSVVLVTTATPLGEQPTTLTLWRADDDQPATTSIATSNAGAGAVSTTIVPLSADGKVRIANLGPAARVSVEVVGWFASPVVAVQLEVPETTVTAPVETIGEVTFTTDPDDPEVVTGAVVTLDPEAPDVTADDHLVLGVSEQTPDGLLATVDEVETLPDGSQVVTTTLAKLDEVFPEGDIALDVGAATPVATTLDAPATRALYTPGLVATTTVMPDPTEGDEDEIEVPDPFQSDDQGPCSAEGVVIDYGPFFDMEFRVTWRTLKAPLVTALATLGAEARAEIRDVVLECSWEKVIVKNTYTFLVAGYPVVLQTTISAELDLDAGLRDINLWAEAKVWVTFGIERNVPRKDAGYRFRSSSLDDALFEATHLTAYAQVDAWLDFGVMLYGVVGPKIGIGPFLETQLSGKPTDPPTPFWTLDLGLAGRVSIRLDLWFIDKTWELWEGEIPLAWLLNQAGVLAACGGESHAFVVGGIPCMSPVPSARANGDVRTMSNRIRLASSTGSIDPLRIVVPDIPILYPGDSASLAFTATGQYTGVDDVLWRVAPNADGSPGAGVPGLAFTRAAGDPEGWSSTGVLAGAVTRVGTYNVPIEVRYEDEGPNPERADREIVPIRVSVVSDKSWVVAWGANDSHQLDVPAGLRGPVLVDAGLWHALALTAEGSIVAWGADSEGQSTVPAWLDNVVGFAAGGNHNLVIVDNAKLGDPSDDTVVAWGRPDWGVTSPPPDLVGVKAVAAGYAHSVALRTDGTVVAWGYPGAMIAVPDILRQPATANVVAIAAGLDHNIALRGNGTVVGWGLNDYGQLDIPSVLKNAATAHVVAIAAGQEHNLALRADGTVVAWGRNNWGQCTVPAGLKDVVAIDGGGLTSLALLRDGTVVGWGLDSHGQATPPVGLAHVTAIAAGTTFAVAVVSMEQAITLGANPEVTVVGHPLTVRAAASSELPVDFSSLTPSVCTVDAASGAVTTAARGTCSIALDQPGDDTWSPAPRVIQDILVIGDGANVVGWGRNGNGQATPPADLVDAVGVDAGLYHSGALLADGTIRLWGRNDWGQTVVPTGLTDVVQLTAGDFHNVVLLADGTVRAWGRNDHLQLAVPAGLDGVVAVDTGGSHTLALKGDGSVVAWGNTNHGRTVVPTGLWDVVAVGAGSQFSAALRANGTVVVWGSNDHQERQVPAGLADVVDIAVGDYHTVALKADGTVVAFGYSAGNRLAVPAGLTDVVAIAAGTAHSVALKADGTVVAWGSTADGALDVPAGLRGVAVIGAGGGHSLAIVEMEQVITITGPEAIAAGGSAMVHATASSGLPVTFSSLTPDRCTVDPMWGAIQTLDVGTCTVAADQPGDATWNPAPQATWTIDLVLAEQRIVSWGDVSNDQPDVPGVLNAIDLAAGDFHTIALLGDGTVVGWAADYRGQASPPDDLSGVTAIAAAGDWSLALLADGSIRAWGSNDFRQLEVPALTDVTAISAAPTYGLALREDGTVVRWGDPEDTGTVPPEGLAGVTAIAAGGTHALAVVDGLVVAWGDDTDGQATVPDGLDDVVAVAAGPGYSLALRGDGTPWGWGLNDAGQADVPVWLGGVVRIAAGWRHALALTGDGGVVTWGTTDYGLDAIPLGMVGVTAIAAGGDHSVTLSFRVDQRVLFDPARPAVVGGTAAVSAWATSFLPVTYASATPEVCAVGADDGVLTLLATGACTVIGTQAGDLRYRPATATTTLPVLPAGTGVIGWGDDSAGQSTVPPGLTDVVAIAAGDAHSLALQADGTVVGWGLDDAGQATPPDGLGQVVAIAAGGRHSLALQADGTVVGWGLDDAGQATPPGWLTRNAVAIAAGGRHGLALLSVGLVDAWGDDADGQTAIPEGIHDVVAIGAGERFSVALLAGGTLVGWGDGWPAPPEGLGPVAAIAAGAQHLVAVLEDGSVVAWGNPDDGRLDVPSGISSPLAVAAGGAHSLALLADGTVVAWGDDTLGATAVPPGLDDVLAIAAGGTHSLALIPGG